MKKEKRFPIDWNVIGPSLSFLALQWWLYAVTAYYMYLHGSQYYAFRQSFYALAAAYISLMAHVLVMITFEIFDQGWKRHGAVARMAYVVVFYDLHACFTFPLTFSVLESKWGNFSYFGSSGDGSWAMFFMAFMFVYTFMGLVIGLIAGVLAALRRHDKGNSRNQTLRETSEQTRK